MNEKFFDLKKEKQDRIVSAALKVMAKSGYAHASTDDIVKIAGISKGLLFHYFENKPGLFSFLYEYSLRYMAMEFKSSLRMPSTDFFTLMEQMADAEAELCRLYPYLPLFLENALLESAPEVTEARNRAENEEKRKALLSLLHGLVLNTAPVSADALQLFHILRDLNQRTLTRVLSEKDPSRRELAPFPAKEFAERMKEQIRVLRSLSV